MRKAVIFGCIFSIFFICHGVMNFNAWLEYEPTPCDYPDDLEEEIVCQGYGALVLTSHWFWILDLAGFLFASSFVIFKIERWDE